MELLKWCRLQWDRALSLAAIAVGAIVIVLGWAGASHTPYIAKQVPFLISGGIGGLAIVIVAVSFWLSADLNDEWRALDRLEATLRDKEPAADAADTIAFATLSRTSRIASRHAAGERLATDLGMG